MKWYTGLMIALGGVVAICSQAMAKVVSGRFEQLDLAVDHGGRILGSYREVQGEGVTKTCAFTIFGSVDSSGRGTIRASAGLGPVQAGTIVASANVVTLALPHGRDFPGCGSVLLPEIATGIELTKTGGADWISLVRIGTERVRLHTTPSSPTGRGYLVHGDIAGVTARSGDWIAVEFRGETGRLSKGWIARGDTVPLTSDARP